MSGTDPRRELPAYALYSRLVARCAWRRPAVSGLPVLLYHSLAEDCAPENAWRFNVRPETFARQMQWLADAGFQTIRADQWPAWSGGAAALPPRRILLTFDDGYRNNLSTALPLLRQHGFHAAFFVSTGFSGSAEPFPWIRGALQPAAFAPLTPDEIRALAQAGMEIGAHAHSHPRLAGLPDEQAHREIRQSKQLLEQWLGQPVTSFAYPYGSERDIGAQHARCCRDAGFTTAFTTRPRISRPGTPPMTIPRLTILDQDGTEIFAQKVLGLFEGYERLRKGLRRVRRAWPA